MTDQANMPQNSPEEKGQPGALPESGEATEVVAAQQPDASELSLLMQQTFSDVTAGMSSEEREAYLSTLFEGRGDQDTLLFAHVTPQVTSTLVVPNYKPDQAMREASLAPQSQWTPAGDGGISYIASNALEVYLGTPEHPLDIPEALQHIRQLSESTVLTSRILMGLWNSRRYNQRVSRDGSVAILVDEVLAWQGIQKHSRAAHPGTASPKRYTEGYRAEQRERVIADLVLLSKCNVRGNCTIQVQGRMKKIYLEGPYLHFTTVKAETLFGTEAIIGFLVAPGGWINAYEQHHNIYLAEVDSQIFTQLHPVNDRYALRIALYLTERWREQAKQGNFSDPIALADLLAASMIEVDRRHLTEFGPAIERALFKLQQMGIVGRQMCIEGFHIGVDRELAHTCMKLHVPQQASAEQHVSDVPPCLTAIEFEHARWGQAWLSGKWEILPPPKLIRAYQHFQAGRGGRGRSRRKKSEQL